MAYRKTVLALSAATCMLLLSLMPAPAAAARVERAAPVPAGAEPCSRWYLAEGSTDWGFDCYITIVNPNVFSVPVDITFMTTKGEVPLGSTEVPAESQERINPKEILGAADFSTRVISLEGYPIAVDRYMSWTGQGARTRGAHSSIGVTGPAKRWYLPEGSSKWGFECWLLIQNPNPALAKCAITYMIEGAPPVTVNKEVPGNGRRSFFMADDIGFNDASVMVESNVPVIPERAMYRNNRREGHDSIGTTAPATDYFLAEGTSGYGFTTYVLVQNPGKSEANVTITYMTPEGPVPQPPFTMPPKSRKTIRVNDVLPGKDFSTQVHANVPIIAERAMYWDNGTGEAMHDSIGLAGAHTRFFLPDGRSDAGSETWTLVQNPNESDVDIELTYFFNDGTAPTSFALEIPGRSRRTFSMEDDIGQGKYASVMVTSLAPEKRIMVERAMYGQGRGSGADTIGGYVDSIGLAPFGAGVRRGR